MTTSIQLPKTVNEFQAALKKGIEAYSESPVKNKNKLNESTAIALGYKNKDTLSALQNKTKKTDNIKYSAIIEDNDDIYINDVLINETLFLEEILKYTVRTVEELIDLIIHYIENTKQDIDVLKEDLCYLKSLEDEFVFTSIETNKYIALSDNPDEYHQLCELFLFENYKFENKWKEITVFFNQLKLPNVNFSTDDYFLEDVISNCQEILEKADWNKYLSFINNEKHQYLFENIKSNKKLQHDSILLICFLVKHYRNTLISTWDFDSEIIKLVFLEMGISTEFYNI